MNQKKRLLLWKCRSISFVILLQLFAIAATAQIKISGKVTGPDGKGVPSASVQVLATTIGTVTDENGNYDFTANLKPGSYTLEFSGVGFKSTTQVINVTSTNTYTANAALTDDVMKMDEVVVTGVSAGTTRKQLGSYISTVKSDQLTKGATGNVLAALQGKTAGAQIIQNNGDPGGGMSVRLRGISSVNSSSEPLYIVDGVIVNNATTRVTNTSGNNDGGSLVGTIGQKRIADHNPSE